MERNKQIKQSVILFISSVLSVIIGIGTSVLNTSLLNPVEYGDYRYVTNLINFFASLLLFGYFVSGSRLLALSSSNEYRRQIRGVMVIILIITSGILMFCMFACAVVHQLWLNSNVSELFIIAIPVCGAVLMLNYINTVFQGDNSINKLSIARVVPALLYLIIAWATLNSDRATSANIMLLYNGCAIAVLLPLIVSTKPAFKNISCAYKELQQENREYGFNVYIGSIAAVSLSYLAGITLGLFNDDNTNVGYYTLALTIATPLAILPTVIGTTYFKKFATQKFIDKKVVIATISLSFASLFAFIIFVPFVVDLLYDDSYVSVTRYAQYLALGTTIHGLGDMFNRFLGSHGKGKELRNGAFLSGIIMTLGNIVFVHAWGINGAIATRILSASSYCFTMLVYYLKFTKKNK